MRGAGHSVQQAVTTTAGSRQLDDYPRQTMNTAIMAGGAIVQVRLTVAFSFVGLLHLKLLISYVWEVSRHWLFSLFYSYAILSIHD